MQGAGLCARRDRLTLQRALPGLCEVAATEGSGDVSQVRRHDHGGTGHHRCRVAQDRHCCRVILLALANLPVVLFSFLLHFTNSKSGGYTASDCARRPITFRGEGCVSTEGMWTA